MKLKNMPKEELELMSYTDLTEKLLKENKKVDAVKFLKNNYDMSLLESKVYLAAL